MTILGRVLVVSAGLVVLALIGSVVLLVLDAWTGFREGDARRVVSAFPLVAIALACLVYHATWTRARHDLLKRGLLSAAFLFWAANQLFPSTGWAPVANDTAIGLFVLDLALVLWGEARDRLAQPS